MVRTKGFSVGERLDRASSGDDHAMDLVRPAGVVPDVLDGLRTKPYCHSLRMGPP